MKRWPIFIIICIVNVFTGFSQERDIVWAFGDSTGLVFNGTSNPPAISTACYLGQEAYATISDQNRRLLFYIEEPRIFNRNHKIMRRGDSLKIGKSITDAVVIIPKPLSNSIYYVFHIREKLSTTDKRQLYYSIVDMDCDSGLGCVVNKNILLNANSMTEKMQATIHSNGVDWWILTHAKGSGQFTIYKLDSSGVPYALTQLIGPSIDSSSSSDWDK